MIDHSPVPENVVPCELLLRTPGTCGIEPEHLRRGDDGARTRMKQHFQPQG